MASDLLDFIKFYGENWSHTLLTVFVNNNNGGVGLMREHALLLVSEDALVTDFGIDERRV